MIKKREVIMLEEGILLFFVVLPTIIAWAVPQLRKRNGNFLITLKTVPVGVLTLYLMDKLITWFYRVLYSSVEALFL